MAIDLASLSRGFRDRLLDYAELGEQLGAWADAFPALCRLSSIGRTEGERELWLLTIGPEPDRVRPAVWIDGNMHASELSGSSVALALAEDVLRLHVAPDEPLHQLPDHVRAALREVLVYVLPRMSPDGAEAVLRTGRYVRSTPRDTRPNRGHARWVAQDIDGDGLALVMRQRDPGGEFVASPEVPGLMLARQLDDPPPYYKVYPEGIIEHFDGHTIPTPTVQSDSATDLNRNFPWSWAPEHEQMGAGAFPTSEPESRAVVEFTSRHPNIFAWLNVHTFGGVFIRPLGHQPDAKMDPDDLALFRQIEAWNTEHTGYPTVSGYEQFTYEPDKPLHGDLTDYAFHQRGAIAYVCELWDLFERVGVARTKRFVDRYSHFERDDMAALARWDAEQNEGRVLRPWVAVEHAQLGPVEVGGMDPRVGLWNPPPSEMPAICAGQAAAFLRVAALAPRLHTASTVTRSGDSCRLELAVENRGYLPTYVLSSAKKLDFNEPLYAEIELRGCELDASGDRRRSIGHLDGWGRGRFDGTGALYYMRSRGNTGARRVSWTVHGRGEAVIRVGSCRVGWVSHHVELA